MFRSSSEDFDVICIDFSPDGHLIASGGYDRTGTIWNWRDGARKTLEGAEAQITYIRFSPDGQYIAAGYPGCVVVWNVCTGQLVEKLMSSPDVDERMCSIAAFMPDGMGFVSAASNGVRLWDICLFGMDGSVSQLWKGRMEVDSNNGKELLYFTGRAGKVRRFCLQVPT